MTPISKQTILFLILIISEVQSSVFIVYPFQVGHTNPSKPTFSMRKGGSDDLKSPKVFDDTTNLHLIYPVKEELVIMTPSPMEGYDEMRVEGTTETTTVYDEDLAESQAHDRTIESLTQDLEEQTTTVALEGHTSSEMFSSTEGMNSDLDEQTSVLYDDEFGDQKMYTTDTTSSVSDMDASTDVMTTEVPLRKSTSAVSSLPSIYDTIGPLKLLRKRMFGHSEYAPIIRMNINKNILTTKRPASKYKRRNKNKSVVVELKDNRKLIEEMKENKAKKDRKTLYTRKYFTSWKKVKTGLTESTDGGKDL